MPSGRLSDRGAVLPGNHGSVRRGGGARRSRSDEAESGGSSWRPRPAARGLLVGRWRPRRSRAGDVTGVTGNRARTGGDSCSIRAMSAGRVTASRISVQKIVADLRLAAKKGDRSALALALDGMRTLAMSPKYWEKYLALLRNPHARLVDLLVLKQGERIAHQKGWKLPARRAAPPAPAARARKGKKPSVRARPAPAASPQPSLFE